MSEIERQWSEIGVGVEGTTDPWDVIQANLTTGERSSTCLSDS